MTGVFYHVICGAMTGLLYALVAMGFVIIYRSSRVFNFAQGEFVALGAFFIWSFAQYFSLPLWLSIVLSFFIAVVFGLVIERIIFRRLIGEELFALVMVTIGLLILIRGAIIVIWSPKVHFFPVIFPVAGFKVGPFMFDLGLLIGSGITIVIAAVLSWIFNHTRMGLEMLAVSEDHQIALSLGLNVKRSIAFAWGISGILCTLAAIIFLSGRGMKFLVADIGLAALPVALLGGLESIGGLIVAGLLIGVSMGVAEYYFNPILQGGVGEVFPFFIMIIILLIRPSGLFGWKRIERV
jgi:branched-chain amino acid transport system permease protein